MCKLGKEPIRIAADRSPMTIDNHRYALIASIAERRQQQAPDFLSIKRFPMNGLKVAQIQLSQFWIDIRQLGGPTVSKIRDIDVAHRPALNGTIRNAPAVE